MQMFLLLSEFGLLGRTCTFAGLSGSVRTTIIAIHNTIHIMNGTAAVGLILGFRTVIVAAYALCVAPEFSLCLTVTSRLLTPAARLARVATPLAPAPGLGVLPLAFPLFLFLATVRVFVGATRITLPLTLLGRIRLSGGAWEIIIKVPVALVPASALLVHLIREEARIQRRLIGEGHILLGAHLNSATEFGKVLFSVTEFGLGLFSRHHAGGDERQGGQLNKGELHLEYLLVEDGFFVL